MPCATALKDLLPGVSLARIDRENRSLIFETQDGELPLDQLSEGYQNMAAVQGDLLYRITEVYRDYKTPLSARGLLLIDEIDLHLHPVWQRDPEGVPEPEAPPLPDHRHHALAADGAAGGRWRAVLPATQ